MPLAAIQQQRVAHRCIFSLGRAHGYDNDPQEYQNLCDDNDEKAIVRVRVRVADGVQSRQQDH